MRTQRWWPASAKWQRFIPIAKPSGTVSEVSTIGNSCIAPNNFQTIFSSIIRSREFVLECTANILGKHCLPARHTIIRPSLLIYRPETTGGLECRVVPAGRLPPDPRLLDHADARQRSSLRPGQAPACRSSLGRPAMLRGGPDRLHQLLLGHHRPPESHRLHPRRHYPSVPGPVVPRVRSADALPGQLAAVLRCGDPEIWGALLNGGCCVLNDLGPSTRACCAG